MVVLVIITTVISLTFSETTWLLNFYLLYSIFCKKNIPFKTELALVYCRFAVDTLFYFLFSINKIYLFSRQISEKVVIKNLIFLLIWPILLVGTVRSTLTFLVTMDRVIGSFFPIFYYNHRHKLSNYIFLIFISSVVILDQYVLFVYCKNTDDIPLECDNFHCMINQCFNNYWKRHERIACILLGCSSILLFLRLFVLTYCQQTPNNHSLSKATLFALVDSTIICLLNILPPFIFSKLPKINFRNYGPLVSIPRCGGSVIEGLISFKILTREKQASQISPVN
ncbi:Serpentine Receptor, class BC (Class B-like) [Caenorhabditis elegans]|uniref:Serpentine Receptor, class BC (Class B-like) n=1 Tax=Caenorhabditis elegans TaxID=6239 RepID=O45557_CAEEL|nr:Serpentine Receptor, class BC (Class B-like) [Caenorhabditis elegans]CAB07621.2 Serpentine Receptor, class BC (Class B-like) [Caenorhabditis elegans]|eukprot:NP_506953.2 Serpentine Receptor, class BC (class B-like) [Caenorhabditis elegans]